MGLSDLFSNPDWAQFLSLPEPVRSDLINVVAFRSFIREAVVNTSRRAGEWLPADRGSWTSDVRKAQIAAEAIAGHPTLIGEVEISLLACSFGKTPNCIHCSVLPRDIFTQIATILAMIEHRGLDQERAVLEVSDSGYSEIASEATTQCMVLLANSLGVNDWGGSGRSFGALFSAIWSAMRNHMLCHDSAALRGLIEIGMGNPKKFFMSLPAVHRKALLSFGASLSKQLDKAQHKTPESKAGNSPPPAIQSKKTGFDRDSFKREHAASCIPFPKLIALQDRISSHLKRDFRAIAIPDYELLRMIGARQSWPEPCLGLTLELDFRSLAYAIIVAEAARLDKKFIAGGVWKKLTSVFEADSMRAFALVAQSIQGGLIGGQPARPEAEPSSIALDLMGTCRKAPRNFLELTPHTGKPSLSALAAGTTVIRHAMNSPNYGAAIGEMISSMLLLASESVSGFCQQDLMIWDEQKDLPARA